ATYASAATNVELESSKLLFGEIPLTSATTIDGRSTRQTSAICILILSTSSVFVRFWLNDPCRENLLNHLDSDDLVNLRLVSHDFSERAALHLFESITSTFRTSTFSKPARIETLSRIGRHVKTFTFRMLHTPETFLPQIVNPQTGEQMKFNYQPQVGSTQKGRARDKKSKYGSWEMQDLLLKQYPPLFHAATNVPAFVSAFFVLTNLTHLKISCPGFNTAHRNSRSTVDYALISIRIAVERGSLHSLSSLSLHPLYPGGLLYIYPVRSFGSTPSSAEQWGQVRRLSICMDFNPSSSLRIRPQSLEHLRILQAYLQAFSRTLTCLSFRWEGSRGPSPLSLDTEPCMFSVQDECVHPSMRGCTSGLPTLIFPRLRYMNLKNVVMDAGQI
ncbi:hypothetical protein EK21DRAFT_17378, partial [Setomelanomma holmii]